MTANSLPVLGAPISRVDGRLKVTGQALYAAEAPASRERDRPQIAHAVLVGSTIASGKIIGIDTAAAAKMPGVLAVLTHQNMPRLRPQQPDEHPVVLVSWNDAEAFCRWLAEKTGAKVRLPYEAEWEYSCRAGAGTKFCFGNDDKELTEYAWYLVNSEMKTHPVGQKKPNAWGLYDMHGNAWQWCSDWSVNRYKEGLQIDPAGPAAPVLLNRWPAVSASPAASLSTAIRLSSHDGSAVAPFGP